MTEVYCFEFETCGLPPCRPPRAKLKVNSSSNSGAIPGRWVGRTPGSPGPVSWPR